LAIGGEDSDMAGIVEIVFRKGLNLFELDDFLSF
jgi:hypothetical protein